MSKRCKNFKLPQKQTAFFPATALWAFQNGTARDAVTLHSVTFVATPLAQHLSTAGDPDGSCPPDSPTTRSLTKSRIRWEIVDTEIEVGSIYCQALFASQPAITDFPASDQPVSEVRLKAMMVFLLPSIFLTEIHISYDLRH